MVLWPKRELLNRKMLCNTLTFILAQQLISIVVLWCTLLMLTYISSVQHQSEVECPTEEASEDRTEADG